MKDITIISLLSGNRKDISYSVIFPIKTLTKDLQLGFCFAIERNYQISETKWWSTVAAATSIQNVSKFRLVTTQAH
jgi:hypothetical protein